MEKKLALLVIAVFAIGTMNGILIGYFNFGQSKPQNIKPEYHLELKPNGSAIIEDPHGNTYCCPDIQDIPNVLLKDNL